MAMPLWSASGGGSGSSGSWTVGADAGWKGGLRGAAPPKPAAPAAAVKAPTPAPPASARSPSKPAARREVSAAAAGGKKSRQRPHSAVARLMTSDGRGEALSSLPVSERLSRYRTRDLFASHLARTAARRESMEEKGGEAAAELLRRYRPASATAALSSSSSHASRGRPTSAAGVRGLLAAKRSRQRPQSAHASSQSGRTASGSGVAAVRARLRPPSATSRQSDGGARMAFVHHKPETEAEEAMAELWKRKRERQLVDERNKAAVSAAVEEYMRSRSRVEEEIARRAESLRYSHSSSVADGGSFLERSRPASAPLHRAPQRFVPAAVSRAGDDKAGEDEDDWLGRAMGSMELPAAASEVWSDGGGQDEQEEELDAELSLHRSTLATHRKLEDVEAERRQSKMMCDDIEARFKAAGLRIDVSKLRSVLVEPPPLSARTATAMLPASGSRLPSRPAYMKSTLGSPVKKSKKKKKKRKKGKKVTKKKKFGLAGKRRIVKKKKTKKKKKKKTTA